MDDEKDRKQKLKAKRIKTYFIQAAKEIIISDGVENVSVRKVADIAGYSYATIYNYFNDINALLMEVKMSMIEDLAAYMIKVKPPQRYTVEEIKKINRRYAGYFLERPHIFGFFYSYRITDPQSTLQAIDYPSIWRETYKDVASEGRIKPQDIETVARINIYTLQGMLALYFSGNGFTQEKLYHEIDNVTNYLLQGGKPS